MLPQVVSGDGEQVLAEGIPINRAVCTFNFFVRRLPDRQGARQKRPAFVGEDQYAAAAVVWILLNLDEATALKRFQRGGQSGPIHRKQRSDGPHRRRLGAIERHEEGKLAVSKFEAAQFLIVVLFS